MNIGQGDGAANGATESDLSGTGIANGIGVADLGGAFAHRTAGGVLTTNTINGTINQQDFESRYDRLMYTTPTFGGFRGQVGQFNSGVLAVFNGYSSHNQFLQLRLSAIFYSIERKRNQLRFKNGAG